MIIALSGYAGSGKDTAFQLIKKNYHSARRFSFADALKTTAKNLTWDGNKDTKGRKFLQDLGQVARAYNKDVWADIVANDIEVWSEDTDIAVITDFRFPNEVEVLKKRFGDVFTVRIFGRAADLGANANDISEHALDDYKFDYYIENNGTMKDFEDRLLYMIKNRLEF